MSANFKICSVKDIVCKATEILRAAEESNDGNARRLAAEVLDLARVSEANLAQRGDSFETLRQQMRDYDSSGLDPNDMLMFFKDCLDGVESENSSNVTGGSLVAFSNLLEGLRNKGGWKGDVNCMAKSGVDLGVEALDENANGTDGGMMSGWRKTIEERNRLIEDYGNLIAFFSRRINASKTRHDVNTDLNAQSQLISFCHWVVAASNHESGESVSPEGAEEKGESEQSPDSANGKTQVNADCDGVDLDLLFVIDSGGSMGLFFESLKTRIHTFINSLKAGNRYRAINLGLLSHRMVHNREQHFLLHHADFLQGIGGNPMTILYNEKRCTEQYQKCAREMLFSEDIELFFGRMESIQCKGSRNTPWALDCAADFPFGAIGTTMRVVVAVTDSPIRTDWRSENIFELIGKTMVKFGARKIALAYISPSGDDGGGERLIGSGDRVLHIPVGEPKFDGTDEDIWSATHEGKDIFNVVGKWIQSLPSPTQASEPEPEFTRAVYGQDTWDVTAY